MKPKKLLATGISAALLTAPCMNVSAAPPLAKDLTMKQVNSLILNVEAYKQAYPDLAAAFGNDTRAYVNHYLTYGIYEGRTKGALFNPLAYAEAYDDLRDVFGDDINALVNHYVRFGSEEKRTIGTSCGYADIAAAQEAGLASASIPQPSAAGYQNTSYSGTPAASETADAAPGGSTNAERWDYYRKNLIYHNDETTLWRVEYYDENNKLKQYSNVTNVDSSTNSYTENVYSYDEVNQVQVLERVDTYVNGVLTSSRSGSN